MLKSHIVVTPDKETLIVSQYIPKTDLGNGITENDFFRRSVAAGKDNYVRSKTINEGYLNTNDY